MKRLFFTVLCLSIILPTLMLAQNRAVLKPNGELQKVERDYDLREIIPIRESNDLNVQNSFNKVSGVMNVHDTLTYRGLGGSWAVNFGFFGQDIMVQWFKAPADMYVHAVAFAAAEVTNPNVSLKLVKLNWTEDELLAAGEQLHGYYEATGNGYNDAAPFMVDPYVADPPVWVEKITGEGSPFGEDLWSDEGAGAPLVLTTDDVGTSSNPVYKWVDMSLLGFSPVVLQGEIFGVVLKNDGLTMDAGRTGFFANAGTGYGAWKYYANGRLDTGVDYGWWSRDYVWDYIAYVELYGDQAPTISDWTVLPTTLSTDPCLVEANIVDTNPSGGSVGVASASLWYAINGGTYTELPMTAVGDVYSAYIPGQSPGTVIEYYISATDVESNTSSILPITYSIFEATEPTLFVYDDNALIGIEWYYWYNVPIDSLFPHDMWEAAFGPVSNVLLEKFQVVYHVMGGGPSNKPANIGEIYKTWLDGATADVPRKLFISGQDYGYISGYKDTTFAAGSFEYDYLGIETLGPQDINYDGSTASYTTPYAVDPVAGDELSGYLHTYAGDSLQLFYDPYYEVGFANWIDNLTPRAEATVCFTDPNHADSAVAIYYSGDNWKTAFWTIDPLALSFYDPADTSSKYHWVLTHVGNPLQEVLEWFGPPVVGINDLDPVIPEVYTLKQNYPNPFNPITAIEYTIPKAGKVELKVYDITGREVITLINSTQIAGAHRVNFDASKMASGCYIYTLKAGDFRSSKKMLLIR